ncbi:hypothetical protein GCM10025864_28040 [Luteimicrobium album]|uniref:Uncharacterized protein n=1 Tax=Luteimicrobium album TaxID=1054550 RepID=A0ABQ6I2Q0_9MICO|nr:hypothetical protein GCM10025864_28040 [Luteimicrobium album]
MGGNLVVTAGRDGHARVRGQRLVTVGDGPVDRPRERLGAALQAVQVVVVDVLGAEEREGNPSSSTATATAATVACSIR